MSAAENRKNYQLFCETEKSIPLFITYDWLNAVAPNNWDVALEYKQNKIVAALPYCVKINKGLKRIELPSFTPIGGPWIKHEKDLKFSTKFRYEREVMSNLIAQLPSFDSFHQKFHPSITNWMPFYWNGFKQTTWYKYRLDDISNSEKVFNNFDSDTRRDIRKAEKSLHVSESNSIDALIELKFKSYRNNKTKTHFNRENFERIFTLCKEKTIGEILVVKGNNKIHAAGLFVWDTDTCYFLITAADPDHKNSGATSLLVWEAIKRYSATGKAFSIEGSMIPSIEEFLRGFGGIQTPYFVISKTNSKLLKLNNFIKNIL